VCICLLYVGPIRWRCLCQHRPPWLWHPGSVETCSSETVRQLCLDFIAWIAGDTGCTVHVVLRPAWPWTLTLTLNISIWRDSPAPPAQWAVASSFTRFLYHTQRRTTVGRTPLDEWSARFRDLYLTTLITNVHAPGGIRTHNPSRQAAADLRLRPRGHWDRQHKIFINSKIRIWTSVDASLQESLSHRNSDKY